MAITEIKKESVKDEVKDNVKVEVKEEVKEDKVEEDDDKEGNVYKFKVAMSCGGCSGAVNRKLSKLQGKSFSSFSTSPPDLLLPFLDLQ